MRMKNLKKTDDRVNRLQVSNNNLKKIIRNSDKQFIFTCYIKYHIQINYREITDARKKISREPNKSNALVQNSLTRDTRRPKLYFIIVNDVLARHIWDKLLTGI